MTYTSHFGNNSRVESVLVDQKRAAATQKRETSQQNKYRRPLSRNHPMLAKAALKTESCKESNSRVEGAESVGSRSQTLV